MAKPICSTNLAIKVFVNQMQKSAKRCGRRMGSEPDAKKANGKYVVYREYHGDPNEVEGSSLFPVG